MIFKERFLIFLEKLTYCIEYIGKIVYYIIVYII